MPETLKTYVKPVKNIIQLRENFVSWAKDNPNTVLLFDKDIINEAGTPIDQIVLFEKDENAIIIEDTKIEWYDIGGKKSVLKEIHCKHKGRLYTDPGNFDEVEVWYYSN